MFLFTFNNFPLAFSVLKEILRLEFLNSFVISLVCFPTYVNLAHFFVICSSCILVLFHSFFITLFKIAVSYLLWYKISFITYFYFSESFMGQVNKRLVKCLITGVVWIIRDSGICCGGFPVFGKFYIIFIFLMAISEKIILFSDSSCKANCIKGVIPLDTFETSWILLVLP